jgi:transposase
LLYLANDQHHKQITVSLRDEEGNVLIRRQVSTRPEKIREFLEQVRDLAGEEGFMATVEVCGFNDWFLTLLEECGCREIVLVQPDKHSRRKTDRRDADSLGQLLWINRERIRRGERLQGIRRVMIPTRQDAEDRQLTATRQRAGRERTRIINALRRILRKHNLTWTQPTKGFDTQAVRRWLQQIALPAIDRLETNQLLARWELVDRQIAELEESIARRAADREDVAILSTTKGLATYGALGLAARIGDVRRFPRPRSLANYFGLTPGCRNSGEHQDRLGSITKQGSQFARFILGQLVLHVLKHDPQMRAWYQRIKRRRGSKIARVAVMRRLCTIFWHMLTDQQPYMNGGPPRRRETRASRTTRRPEPIAIG